MIEFKCVCGKLVEAPESSTGGEVRCKCGKVQMPICGEQLAAGAGVGDFDRALDVIEGPAAVGWRLALGGVAEITVGKVKGKHIILAGNRVSRNHCKFVRQDFGPSKWIIEDQGSTNGVYVNQHRLNAPHELQVGDTVEVGEFVFRYVDSSPPIPEGPKCPHCRAPILAGAKLCVSCGTDLKSGKRLVISKALDENQLAETADAAIRTVSWIIPFGFLPIASEALGKYKAHVTFALVALTAIASLVFMFSLPEHQDEAPPAVQNLMLWSGTRGTTNDALVKLQSRKRTPNAKPPVDANPEELEITDEDLQSLSIAEIQDAISAARVASLPPEIGFRPWQMVTHAFLHDPSGIIGFIFHFGGNLVFLFVFGMRVNECIGGLRFAIVYIVLAIGAAGGHMLMTMSQPMHPMLGASGAIMGLAGMYFVLYPVQHVHAAIWFRGGILTGWRCFYKVFPMRGFWLLIILIAWNDLLPVAMEHFFEYRGSTAHGAHLGGFICGMLVATIMLLTKQAHTHGSDLLSMVFGQRLAPVTAA